MLNLLALLTGPKVNNVQRLGELRKAGVNVGTLLLHCLHPHKDLTSLVVRMNFSHGEYEYHQSVIDNTRKMVAGMHCLV
jgi:pyruvate kinase